MGQSHKETKNQSRPKKKLSLKVRRMKVQRARLVGLGYSSEKAAKLTGTELRALLRRPGQLKV